MSLRNELVDTIAKFAKVGPVRVQALVTALDEHEEDAILGELSELEEEGKITVADVDGAATVELVS